MENHTSYELLETTFRLVILENKHLFGDSNIIIRKLNENDEDVLNVYRHAHLVNHWYDEKYGGKKLSTRELKRRNLVLHEAYHKEIQDELFRFYFGISFYYDNFPLYVDNQGHNYLVDICGLRFGGYPNKGYSTVDVYRRLGPHLDECVNNIPYEPLKRLMRLHLKRDIFDRFTQTRDFYKAIPDFLKYHHKQQFYEGITHDLFVVHSAPPRPKSDEVEEYPTDYSRFFPEKGGYEYRKHIAECDSCVYFH